MEWTSGLSLWTKTILTRGSEFLMAWTSWSQTWSTKSTTTTSRRTLQRRRKVPSGTCSSSRPGAQFDQAYPVAKRITLFFDTENYLEEDGAIQFWRLKEDLRNKFEHSEFWSDNVWKSMAKGGGKKNIFQYCTDSSWEILYFRALQGHSGRNPIDPSLHDNVLIPNNFFEYIYHIGCAVNLHSITNPGVIAGGQNSSRDRQTVFFTAVNPMHKNHQHPKELSLTKPCLYLTRKWKVHQDTVHWVDIQLAQRKGLKFYQTRSNAVILFDTLPAYCISKVVVMKSEEVINQKVYVSPRRPPKSSYKDNWTCDSDSVNQEKHAEVTEPASTERPVSGHESTKRCVLTPRHVENDQTGTEKPVTVDQKEEHKIDFRVPGLSQSVVKVAEHLRVQELVKKDRKSSSSKSISCRLAAE